MSFTEKEFYSLNSKGFHRLVYNDWGDADGWPIICVHGLTCNGHDFDYLAEALIKDGHRLICLDLPGRGRSDFLPDPMDYNYGQYLTDITALLNHLGLGAPQSVDWIGVSLGGLLGMTLAGVENSPIRRMIINDVGPEVPADVIPLLKDVILQYREFNTIPELEKNLRELQRIGWGKMSDEQWRHMAEHNARAADNGNITYAFDPDIAQPFEAEPTGDADLWAYWDKITCPVLLIRGGLSPILTKEILKQMQARGPGPKMKLETFNFCAHAPSLSTPKQIKVIQKWLSQ